MFMIVFLYDGLLLLFLTITCFGNGRKCDQNYSFPIKVDETYGRFSHNLIFTLPLMFIYPLAFCNFNYFSYSDTSSSDLIYLIFFLILLIPFAIYTAIDWIWDPFSRLDEDARPTSGYKYLYLMKYTFGILPFVVLMILFSGLNSVAEILSVVNLIVIYIFVCTGLFILDSVKLDPYKSKSIFFNDTLRHNIVMGCMVSEDKLKEVIKLTHLIELVEKQEHGLDEMILDNGANFSGGEKQRINLARALIRNLKVLFLDESFFALDIDTENAIRSELFKKDITILEISHRENINYHYDNKIVLG